MTDKPVVRVDDQTSIQEIVRDSVTALVVAGIIETTGEVGGPLMKKHGGKSHGVTADQVIELIVTTFKNRERKIVDNAARHATEMAISRMTEYLQNIGVLDESGQPKPGQRMKVRIVDPRCYPPLVMQ